nr:hypothetical protein Itr_chr04CG10320 [Ipomoea trifida]
MCVKREVSAYSGFIHELFSLRSLLEVGTVTEAAAVVSDEKNSFPPPLLGLLRRMLRRHIEVRQVRLHLLSRFSVAIPQWITQ